MYGCKLPRCPDCRGKHIGVVKDSIRNLTMYKLVCLNDSCPTKPETKWNLDLKDIVQEWGVKGR